MIQTHDEFSRACRQAFSELVTRFDFAEPKVESIGRECFVRYHKGDRTVSIAWEPGSQPVVELFHPAGPTDLVTPWAARGGVAYTRRCPRAIPQEERRRPKPGSADVHLVDSMKLLAEREHEFLSAAAS